MLRRDLRLLVTSVGLSALGDFVALIALMVRVHDTTRSGFAIAALAAANWLPIVLLAPVAGLVADRVESRKLIAAVSAAQVAVAVALAFTTALAPLLALMALLGAGVALVQPAEFALVPAVAGEAGLAGANGRVETARGLGAAVGPLLGGALVAAGGSKAALLLDAATFAWVAGAACVLRARRTPAAPAAVERARDGVAFLASDAVLRRLMVAAGASLVFMSMSVPAEVFFAKDVLGAGDVGLGALFTAWTLGMALGASRIAPRVAAPSMAAAALVAIAMQGAGLALGAIVALTPVAIAAFAFGGVAHGAKNTLIRTVIHVRTPDRLRGRAYAAYNAIRNAAELGALGGGGALVTAIGARGSLTLAGAVPIGVAALALAEQVRPAAGRAARRRAVHHDRLADVVDFEL